MKHLHILAILMLICMGCNIRKTINPTAREKYKRSFQGPDSLMDAWKLAYDRSLNELSLPVGLPFQVTAGLHPRTHMAIGYRLPVNKGQQLVVELDRMGDSSQVFVELFRARNQGEGYRLTESMDERDSVLLTTIEEDDTLRLVIQPAIFNYSPFRLRIYSQPAFLFPVVGKGNTAVSSYWGAARDGGSRQHEGVDIFAARGTPVVAVADGRITSTGDRGLGGKQVWQRDALFGLSIYYAHLDSITARDGRRVKRGDTLGLVGNTGNAITTSPHLHFGIYDRGGAIDPILFIKQMPMPTFADTKLKPRAITRNNKNELRQGPDTRSFVIYSFPKNDTMQVIGKTGSWFQVQYGDTQGFIQESSIRLID